MALAWYSPPRSFSPRPPDVISLPVRVGGTLISPFFSPSRLPEAATAPGRRSTRTARPGAQTWPAPTGASTHPQELVARPRMGVLRTRPATGRPADRTTHPTGDT